MELTKLPREYIISTFGAFLLLLTFIFLQYTPIYNTMLVISGLIIVVPPLLKAYVEYQRVKRIEAEFPDFLRETAESVRSGMTLPKAVSAAAKTSYGPIKKELERVAAQISWGVPFDVAMQRFAKRCNSTIIKQAVTIICEANKAGGKIVDILETVAENISKLKSIQSERETKMRSFTISIYVIFFLFLGIILVLSREFLPAIPQMSAISQILGTGTPSKLSVDDYVTMFFHLSVIQGFFAGIIAGMMGGGRFASGLKHSVILVIISVVAFQVFVGNQDIREVIADLIGKIPPQASGMESPEVYGYLRTDISTGQIVYLVKKAVQEKGYGWFDLTEDRIIFVAEKCNACARGDIEVTSSSIKVNKPARVKFKIINTGEKYIIKISDEE